MDGQVYEGEIDEAGMEILAPTDTSSQAITLFDTTDPHEALAKAADIAGALQVVLTKAKLTVKTGGNARPYVLAEGWTCLGSLVGVFPRTVWTRKLEDGWEARVEAVTLGGAVVGSAESQCTRAEKLWASRDEYALRSMAQTRAMSKALRMPLGFIVVLAGFEATPADEMPRDMVDQPAAAQAPWSGIPDQLRLHFGKFKGQTVGEVASHDRGYLGWLASKYEPKTEQDEVLVKAAGAFLKDDGIPF